MPLRTTQALNGASVMPTVRRVGPNTSTISFFGPASLRQEQRAQGAQQRLCTSRRNYGLARSRANAASSFTDSVASGTTPA
jgi:hypothetical protein